MIIKDFINLITTSITPIPRPVKREITVQINDAISRPLSTLWTIIHWTITKNADRQTLIRPILAAAAMKQSEKYLDISAHTLIH